MYVILLDASIVLSLFGVLLRRCWFCFGLSLWMKPLKATTSTIITHCRRGTSHMLAKLCQFCLTSLTTAKDVCANERLGAGWLARELTSSSGGDQSRPLPSADHLLVTAGFRIVVSYLLTVGLTAPLWLWQHLVDMWRLRCVSERQSACVTSSPCSNLRLSCSRMAMFFPKARELRSITKIEQLHNNCAF